jgi:hypothetical protein
MHTLVMALKVRFTYKLPITAVDRAWERVLALPVMSEHVRLVVMLVFKELAATFDLTLEVGLFACRESARGPSVLPRHRLEGVRRVL